ncbi:MAG TPA: M1 family aminopeptidase [Puia sp.]|nr:M1 family aminopeptidase [Puia sp.]
MYQLLLAVLLFAPKPAIDVQHYDFSLTLSDSNNIIHGTALITLEFKEPATEFSLDLTGRSADGKGMTVSSVSEGKKNLPFIQTAQQLIIKAAGASGQDHKYKITYSGIPADGLIISNNKFGKRGFFGDNWPNRAHNWLPCIDHPSDKATLDFRITAPDHYTVVANGALQEQTALSNHRKLTHWKESEPLAPKIMVIGVADFAVDHPGDAMGIPVWNYVYKENEKLGFSSYAVALQILPFYITHIGPYPFEKEGNVQSKTRFGGLENASAIFYYENSVGSPGIESLMAHEIAHQWFGDAATETQWKHLWLSEGFATYMTLCYLENKYGPDTLRKSLARDRKKVIAFEKTRLTPVIDTSVKQDYMQLLNPNSYEKGGWVLHMLRRRIGDTLFWKGISTYYTTYRNKNASSADFEKIMDKVSGQNLDGFFHQWLDQPGHPHVTIACKYDPDKKTLSIDFTQHATATASTPGDRLFEFPLEYSIDGNLHTVDIKGEHTHVDLPFPEKPVAITPDPNVNLLADFDLTT